MRISGLIVCGLCAVMIGGAAFAEEPATTPDPDRKKVTSQYYVDEQLKSKQPVIGNNNGDYVGKVVMAPTSYDIDPDAHIGTPGAKPIAESLSVGADTDLPKVGAVNGGLDDKQNTLSGTNGYVVTRGRKSGTTDQLTGNPIYSTSVAYEAAGDYNKANKDGVIKANTANAAISRGLNGHLQPVTTNQAPGNVNWLYTIRTETDGTDYTR